MVISSFDVTSGSGRITLTPISGYSYSRFSTLNAGANRRSARRAATEAHELRWRSDL
jgi:hypothetical protein